MCKEVFQLSCRPRKQRWGPRWLPKDGHLQAHSFAGNLSLFTVCFEHLNIWKTFAPLMNEIASQEKSKVLCAGCMSLQREQRRKLMPAVETNLVSTCWDWLRIREPRNLEMGYESYPKNEVRKAIKVGDKLSVTKRTSKRQHFFSPVLSPRWAFQQLCKQPAACPGFRMDQQSWQVAVGWNLKRIFFYQFGKVAARWGRCHQS